jgi:HNH endonuclease
MNTLDRPGIRLLEYLVVSILPKANPKKPETFTTYSEVHKQLDLTQQGATFGESLKRQGLSSLADWTKAEGVPAITGLIVSEKEKVPGKGYFNLFNRTEYDFEWWASEIEKSKLVDWSPFLPLVTIVTNSNSAAVIPNPLAVDIDTPPDRQKTTVYRILRDTNTAMRVKEFHNHECQLCGKIIELPNGRRYAEAHHIKPLGTPHSGPDVAENILCLCPNHHAELDYGVIALDLTSLRKAVDHTIDAKYINYHNELIYAPKYLGSKK